jgi:probable HAF family extracellular repeat protein
MRSFTTRRWCPLVPSAALGLVLVAMPAMPASASPSPAAGVPGSYRVVDLGTLGGDSSFANAINDHGQIVGQYVANAKYHPFLWHRGTVTLLGDPTVAGAATDINNHGLVVGSSGSHAFSWHNGIMTDLGTLGGPTSFDSAVNDRGQILGMADTTAGDSHAVLWDQGRTVDLGALRVGDINNRGTVVGMTDGPDTYHAFR